jgi:hypothetical protein
VQDDAVAEGDVDVAHIQEWDRIGLGQHHIC